MAVPPAGATTPAGRTTVVTRAVPSSAASSRSPQHALGAAANYTPEVLALAVPVVPARGTRAAPCGLELASGPADVSGDPVNGSDPSGECVSIFGIVCVGGGPVTTTVSLGFNPTAGAQTLADLAAGIGNGFAQFIDSLPGTICGGATIGYAIGIPLCNWVQSQASNYLDLGISIPYMSCGWLGQFQAGEYSFGTAWGEVFPGAVAGDLIIRASTVTVDPADLSGNMLSNYNRFLKSLPSGAGPPTIIRLPYGDLQFSADVPATNIPGSYATYTKVVGPDGATISFYKTTVAPDGSVVSVKVKYP